MSVYPDIFPDQEPTSVSCDLILSFPQTCVPHSDTRPGASLCPIKAWY